MTGRPISAEGGKPPVIVICGPTAVGKTAADADPKITAYTYTDRDQTLQKTKANDNNVDYTSGNDYGQDLDEYTQELDEDYVRDSTDYETLAYKHYA